MQRLDKALRHRSDRGTPVGADAMIERVAMELQGQRDLQLVDVREGGHETATQTTRPKEEARSTLPPQPRWRTRITAGVAFSAAFMLIFGTIGVIGVLGLLGDGVEEIAVTAEPTVATGPQTTMTSAITAIDPWELTWVRIPHDDGIFGDAEHGSLIAGLAGEDGRFLAVGTTGPAERGWPNHRGTVWASDGATTWIRLADHEDDFGVAIDMDTVTYELRGVTATETGWVAVGYSLEGETRGPAIWTSPDGATWTRVTAETSDAWPLVFNDVASNGSLIVAVGFVEVGPERISGLSAAVWVSEDTGATWRPVPQDEAVFGAEGDGNQQMKGVEAGPVGFVAVGQDRSGGDSDAAVWTSPDGITWSRVPHDEASLGGPGTQRMNDVVATEFGYLAVGYESLTLDESEPPLALDADQEAAVWVSEDGITWTRVPHDEEVFGGEGHQRIEAAAAGPAGIVAVGTSVVGEWTTAAVWVSQDGFTWARVPHDDEILGGNDWAGMFDVVPTADGFLVGGSVGVTGDLGAGWVAAVWLASPPG